MPEYLLGANPAVIQDRQYDDFEEQALRLIGYDQTYFQLTPGAFSGRFLSCLLGPVSVHVEQSNQALEQTVAGHPNAVTLGVLARSGAPFRLNGAAFTGSDVLIAMPGGDLHLRSPSNGAVVALVVEQDVLWRHPALSRPTRDRLCASDFGTQLLPAPQLARRIREDVVQAIQSANFEAGESDDAMVIGDALLSGIVSKLSLELSGHDISLPQLLTPASYERFLAGRKAIHTSWETIHSLGDLLPMTAAGRRTLQADFASNVDVGPLTYHRLLRLHMARRALRSPACFNLSIGDIAARYDFWSWSQFSRLYQSHFGLLPSDTRAKAGISAPAPG